ncbi:iron ABC transporter permease [Microbacterium sp. MPKO10]|uniref:FecCD family ABC transporter permease n=1 Tax=Microbacterium sp. MPKO10 TaxID=2989818 RepID=UPI002235A932|nr:iron ABC transporter permease [Microbacterium sp. MPKO10]MCW4458933.1 iron ABC transporter permease [Microbacterium sp. MPKO10]
MTRLEPTRSGALTPRTTSPAVPPTDVSTVDSSATGSRAVGRNRRAARIIVTTIILSIAAGTVALLTAGTGQYAAGPGDVVGSLVRGVLGRTDDATVQLDAVLWSIRFPRALLALIAGACLAVAGAVMQGVFANPLAEPSIVGVNSGASVGATLVIVTGVTLTASWALPVAAFAGALVVTLLVWSLSRAGGKAAVLTLVLAGIAINAVASAVTSFLIFLGDASSREQVIFWQLGTLSGASWGSVAVTAGVFAVGFTGCLLIRTQLDVLALGDSSAASSGVRVEWLRVGAILLSCLLTGTAVAFGGVIAFVGLIVPHAIRLAVGPSHRALVPLSALGGAVLLGAADIAARTIVPFADLPIGIFTAVVGGPLFLILLRRTLRGQGARA